QLDATDQMSLSVIIKCTFIIRQLAYVFGYGSRLARDKENYLEHPIPEAPVAPPGQQVPPAATAAHAAWVKEQKEVDVLMLLTMNLDIQSNLAHLGAYDMLQELKAMFSKQTEQELLQTMREFYACKQEEGQSVSSYVLKMKGYIDNLERLGQPVGQNLAVSLILVFLYKDYDSFVQNYNMHNMGKIVNELHAMLKLHEDTLPKKDANPTLHAIRAGRVQKNQKNKPHKAAKGGHGKVKSKMGYAPNNVALEKELSRVSRQVDKKRRSYLRELALQGLRGSKKLKPGALSLYVGDGHRAAVEAIGSYHLELPSRLVIILNNCYYAPSITKGVISVSHVFDDGFINRFDENNVISGSKDNLVYFMAVPRDGIFEIDMSCSNTNDSSMYAISNKRAKINLESSLLWHCRLGHISKKHIEKLPHDGLLNYIDIESLGKCVSCMSGKMARKPYSHQVERAKYLLGLIHIDVCGPFRIVSRQGANYFVIFTVDFSRYGYVYLLKHKHEVFETFKVFQKEVENQLGKTIKSICFDRGDEYTSQDFLDHLKEHGIISHNTPPYTPQHNGVSERRNRTLLDMVDKTPYEIWHGQAPNPSENKVFVTRNTEFFEDDLIDLKASGSVEDLELIQEKYINPSLDTSLDHEEDDQEICPSENKVFVTRNTEFFENDLIDLKASRSVEDLELIQEKYINPSLNTSLYHEEDDQEIDEPQRDLGEPANYKDALLNPESKKWLDSMNVEMQSIKENDTKMDGAVYVFKARLVANGFTQTYGVDYEETFSPVADIRAIRILIAIAAYYDYEIWKIDVKTTFLNGHLSEEVYMEQPEGFVNPKYPNHATGSYVAILILYIDDILLIGNNIPMLQDIKSYLGRSFAMKDLGDTAYILGIKIYRDRTIPIQEKLKLSKSQGASTPAEKQRMQNVPYASAIGSIMDMFLVYGGNMERELRVSCYTDAGYLTDADDLKSQTGYVFVLKGGAVNWKSTKQSIFATSSTNAEYIAAFDASMEAVWIRKFIFGLGIVPTIKEPIGMYCDNTGAIAIAKNNGVTKGASHFHAKVHYLCETIKLGDVKIEKFNTDDNLADPFTNALAFPKHSKLTRNIGMLPASSFM
nr:hypothetical protein [Tanacetum cinerariifolium]